MDISALGNTANTEAAATAATANMALGKDDFLTLLLTQLQYQDPLSPQDSAEFTAQLTQFSTLEELTNVNTTLSDILGAQQSMENASATNLIGKEVRVPGDTAYLTDTAELGFRLMDGAASAKISVYNASGTLVRTEDIGSSAAGINLYTWDGKDNNGDQLPAGSYTFKVEAQDAAGDPVETTTATSGTVTDLLYEDNTTYLRLEGGIITTLDQILSVSERRI
jgi:flagellar basal-body rod modification protein FlgD